MSERRSELSADFLRHGSIEGLSHLIESGQKPDYSTYVQLMRGDIDPSIDRESTQKVIELKIASGEIKQTDLNVIIHSSLRRAQETAEMLRDFVYSSSILRPSDDLVEVKLSMEHISQEEYEGATNMSEIIDRVIDDFLHGATIDETAVQAYRRAERFLTFFRRIRKLTTAHPLFVTHGIFARILELAIRHDGQKFEDKEIKTLLQQELSSTNRPGVLEGLRVENTEEGSKILSV